jgi:hypothetical protein
VVWWSGRDAAVEAIAVALGVGRRDGAVDAATAWSRWPTPMACASRRGAVAVLVFDAVRDG